MKILPLERAEQEYARPLKSLTEYIARRNFTMSKRDREQADKLLEDHEVAQIAEELVYRDLHRWAALLLNERSTAMSDGEKAEAEARRLEAAASAALAKFKSQSLHDFLLERGVIHHSHKAKMDCWFPHDSSLAVIRCRVDNLSRLPELPKTVSWTLDGWKNFVFKSKGRGHAVGESVQFSFGGPLIECPWSRKATDLIQPKSLKTGLPELPEAIAKILTTVSGSEGAVVDMVLLS